MDRRDFLMMAGAGSLALMLPGDAAAQSASAPTSAGAADHVSDRELHRIVWGSCCHQDKPQPIWGPLNAYDPDLLIMLGDNIYADTEDMAHMKALYAMLGAQPGYQQVKARCPIVAIWDDHDYGVNDGGMEYPMKAESKQVMLDFFDEPADSPRRSRMGNYVSYLYGPAGRRVQVILPDSRTFRSPIKTSDEPRSGNRGAYLPTWDPARVMLGEQQWQWLDQQLAQPAELRILGMSTQFLPEFNGHESWANFPLERERLLDLLRKHRAEHSLILSGDTHWAELARYQGLGLYPLYEMTSSGLTEVWENIGPNIHRVGEGYLGPNFGSLEIDWGMFHPSVTMRIHDVDGKVVIERKVAFAELQFTNAAN